MYPSQQIRAAERLLHIGNVIDINLEWLDNYDLNAIICSGVDLTNIVVKSCQESIYVAIDGLLTH